MDKRAKRGILLYISCCFVIILIGIISIVNNYTARGPVGGRLNHGIANLSGVQIIWVGIFMLIFAAVVYFTIYKDRNKN